MLSEGRGMSRQGVIVLPHRRMRHEKMQELLLPGRDAEKLTWETPKVGVCHGDRAEEIPGGLGFWLCSDIKIFFCLSETSPEVCPSVFPLPARVSLVTPLTAAGEIHGESLGHTQHWSSLSLGLWTRGSPDLVCGSALCHCLSPGWSV